MPKGVYIRTKEYRENMSVIISAAQTFTKLQRIDAFWKKVDISGDCWEWVGSRLPKGYGRIGFKDETGKHIVLAHRFSYETFIGLIPEGLFVCHSCDNPPCIRPSHLWLGTKKDNAQDSVKKGRFVKGDRLSPEGRKRISESRKNKRS